MFAMFIDNVDILTDWNSSTAQRSMAIDFSIGRIVQVQVNVCQVQNFLRPCRITRQRFGFEFSFGWQIKGPFHLDYSSIIWFNKLNNLLEAIVWLCSSRQHIRGPGKLNMLLEQSTWCDGECRRVEV